MHELEQAGCLIALGTDNMAEDMVEVVRTALFMERVRRQDGRQPTPEQALGWATRNGYRALGITDGGWLAEGNLADLIVIDLREPHLTPALRVVSDFVHQGQASDVEAVMVDGRFIMRDGRVQTLDERAIVAEAERIARRGVGTAVQGASRAATSSRPRSPSQLTGQSSAIRASFAWSILVRWSRFGPFQTRK